MRDTRRIPQNISQTAQRVTPGVWIYDKDLGCLVPKYGRNSRVNEKHADADIACPMVIAGGMPEIFSHADGKRYDTKRNYYKAVARAGAEIVGFDKRWQEHIRKPEIYDGGDPAHTVDIVKDVKKSLEQEHSKLPPRGTAEYRRRLREQRRKRREGKA